MMKTIIKTLVIMVLLLLQAAIVSAAYIPLDMVYVSSGYSMMGAEYGDLLASNNAKPYHLIYLDPFYIDIHEVTNGDYATCVAAGACKEPESYASKTREDYYTNPTFVSFPVVNVTWQDAADYCEFVDKRLPTEAEWERAARGIRDNRRYPWGNSSPRSDNMNISLIPGDTERGDIYPKGYSPYGVADMAGNVSEWVSDWYQENWYENKEKLNPQGPVSGLDKVVRGSSFETDLTKLHLAERMGMEPASYSYSVGFRCAQSIRESIGYDYREEDKTLPEKEFRYVKAGNENGIFLLEEPGTGYDTALIAVVPNGAVVEILVGPVSINYSEWYQVQTQSGETGWTIASSLVSTDDPQ
jgi:formylglycine-generating enzyme required for sulfatase activity